MCRNLLWTFIVAMALFSAGCDCGGGGATPFADVLDMDPGSGEGGEEGDVPDQPDAIEVPDGQETDGGEVEIQPDAEIPPPPEPVLHCFFITAQGPKGQDQAEVSLTSADEPTEYADKTGFQVDFGCVTDNLENGRDVELHVAANLVATLKVEVDPDTGKGLVMFSSVTLTHNPAGYEVKAVATNQAQLTGQDAKTVHVDIGTCGIALVPKNTTCVLADVNPDKPGLQVVFTITTPDKTCDTAEISFAVNAATGGSGPVLLDESGSAQLELTLLDTTEGVDGVAVSIDAVVSDSKAPGREGSLTKIAYTIDLVDPVLAIGAPTKTSLNLGDDKDGVPDNGIQIDVSGVATGIADGSEVTLLLNGAVSGTTKPQAGGAFLFADVTLPNDGAYGITVAGKDACGRVGQASINVQAKVSKAKYVVTFPPQGGTLLAKDDKNQDPAAPYVFDTTFEVLGPAGLSKVTLTVECRKDSPAAPWFQVGSLVIAAPSPDGVFKIDVALDASPGKLSNKVACHVRDSAVNPSVSEEVAFTVGMPAPALSIVQPAPPANVFNTASMKVVLKSENLAGVTPVVQVVDANQTVVVDFAPPAPLGATGATYQVPLLSGGAPIADGNYSLVVDAVDTWGNKVSEVQGGPPQVEFTLDTTAPTVAITAPKDDVLDPATNPDHADSDPVAPGYQTTVIVEVVGESPEGVKVCLSVAGNGDTCQILQGGAADAVFSGVTLTPGANLLSAYAVDIAKNTGPKAERTITLNLQGPKVAIVSPAKDTCVAILPLDITVLVTDTAGSPSEGAEVALLVNGVALPDKKTTDAFGHATFQVSQLSEAGDKFVASAVAGGVEGWSAPRSICLKTGVPDLKFDSPKDGDVINLAFAACSPGQEDCVMDVVLTAGSIEDGATGDLVVDCGSGAVNWAGAVNGGKLTFPDVSLGKTGVCGLTASATDAVGQKAQAGPIQVTVDRVAPQLPGFVYPPINLNVLEYTVDEDKAKPGLQYTVWIRAGGLEQGRDIVLKYGAGPTDTTQIKTASAIPDGKTMDLPFPQVTLPNGTTTLDASASDTAGNPSKVSRSIFVWAGKPMVWIQLPAYVAANSCSPTNKCPAGAYCTPAGKCATPWGIASIKSIFVAVNEVPDAVNNLRICSDSSAVTGPACSSAGFKQVAITTAPVPGNLKEIDLSALADDAHTLIAEVKVTDALPWESSLDEPDPAKQRRNVFVDKVAPAVNSIDVASDLDPKKLLNAAEAKLVSPDPAGGGTYAVTFNGSEPGKLTVYLNGLKATEVAEFNGATSLDIAFKEGPNEVYCVLADQVGNLSPVPPQGGVYYYNPTVDTKVPTLSFVNPAGPVVKAGDSLDVVLKSDAVGQKVTVQDGGADKGSATVGADQLAVIPFATTPILTDGQHQLAGKVSDKAGNQATAQMATTVDVTVPTVTLAKPLDKTELTEADDAQPGQAGFQVEVSFTSTSADAATWTLKLETNCVAGNPDPWAYTQCDAPTTVATGEIKNPGGTEASLYPTIVAGATPYLRFTLTVEDKIGNKASQSARLKIATACQVSVEGTPGAWINNSSCPTPGTNCASVDRKLTVKVAALCGPADTVKLFRDGVEKQSKPLVGQTAEFTESFADGATVKLEAKAYSGAAQVGSSGEFQVKVDLTDPVVKFEAPAAGSNNVFAIAADKDQVKADLQIDLKVSASDINLAGGKVTALTYDSGAGPQPLAFSAADFTGGSALVDLPATTLPDQTAGTVAVTVADVAGNTAQSSFGATVDIQAPAAIVLTKPAGADVDRRLPSVLLKWAAPGDNGAAGKATSYDIRYSTLPIATDSDFANACKVANLAYTGPVPTPAAAGTAESFLVTGPDARPLNVTENGQPCKLVTDSSGFAGYNFAVRAIDDVGNVSPIGPNSTVNVDFALRFATVSPTIAVPPNAEPLYLQRSVYFAGDINGDGLSDVAIGGLNADTFCVLYGNSTGADKTIPDLTVSTADGPYHKCWVGAAGSRIGSPVAYLGDVNGDGVDDVAVGEGNTAATNKVSIYLGVKNGKLATAPNVVIKGINGGLAAGVTTCGGGDFDGDGAKDLILALRAENKAYIVPGNKTWNAATNLTMDMALAADKTANRVVTLAMSGTISGTAFGFSCVFVKDVNKDGFDEAGVGTYGDPSQVVVIKGRAVPAAVTYTYTRENLGGAGTDDANAVRLRGDPSSPAGFGNLGRGLWDLDGDGRGDVLLNHVKDAVNPSQKTVYGFYGSYFFDKWGQVVQVLASGSVGDGTVSTSVRGFTIKGSYFAPVVLGNFDNDKLLTPSADIAYVLYSTTSEYGKVFLRFNIADPKGSYGQGVFPFEAPVLVDPLDPSGKKFGEQSVATAGDFNGDGLPDLLVGTFGAGYVMIMY